MIIPLITCCRSVLDFVEAGVVMPQEIEKEQETHKQRACF